MRRPWTIKHRRRRLVARALDCQDLQPFSLGETMTRLPDERFVDQFARPPRCEESGRSLSDRVLGLKLGQSGPNDLDRLVELLVDKPA